MLAIAATVSLGRWQLSRAAQKEALQAGIDAQKLLPPIGQDEFLAIGDVRQARPEGSGVGGLMYRPVKLRGLWLAPQTVYLDNRQMNGLQGFYVLTPFAIEGSEQTVMVQRGWVQRNFNDRTQLAPLETPAGLVELTALVAPPPAHLLELGRAEPPLSAASTSAPPTGASSDAASPAAPAASDAVPGAPVGSYPIRQNLNLQTFRAESRLPLRTDLSLQQTGAASDGLQRNWPAPALGVEKHYGYAFQWFGLSALVAVLFVWFQLVAPWLRRRRERRERQPTVFFTQPNDPR
jgi:cytochrome oxidase assembly protein ShyY1